MLESLLIPEGPFTPDMLIAKGDSCTECRGVRDEGPAEKEEETPEAEDEGADSNALRSALAFCVSLSAESVSTLDRPATKYHSLDLRLCF